LARDSAHERLRLALGYVRHKWPQAHIVFGAELPQQVVASAAAFDEPLDPAILQRIEEEFSDVEEQILNPTLWPKVLGKS
jgi:aryl-alcohol dehydrogenase-like predicted oxidoreductase